jgi:hypothetical protein
MKGAKTMKYVLTASEIAKFTGISKSAILVLFGNGEDIPHIWAGSQLRVMSFPFLQYLEGRVDDEKMFRLRQYLQD